MLGSERSWAANSSAETLLGNRSMTGERSSDRRLIIRNAASAYAARGALGVSVLVLTPVLFRRLGVGGFGTWSVVFAFGTVFALGELGFARGFTKVTAQLLAEGRRRDLARSYGVSMAMLFALGVVAAVAAAVVGLSASGLAAPGFEHDFRWGMLVLGVERLLAFPFAAAGAALAGYQRYDLYNGVAIANSVGFTIAALVIVGRGGGVLAVVIAWSIAHFASGLLLVLFLRRIDPALRFRPRLGDRELRRSLAGFSSFVLLAESMTFIGQRMDTIVIAAIRNGVAAGPYAAVLKLQTALQSLTLPFVYLLMPMVSDLWARGRSALVLERLGLATRISCQLTLPFAAALAIFSEDVVHVWLGKGAPSVTWQILILLMVAQVPALTAAPSEQVLIGIGRVRAVGTLAVIEGLGNLSLSIVLISRYGAIGAAIGTLSTTALLAPIKVPLAVRALGGPVRDFLFRSIAPSVLASLPAIVAMAAVRVILPPGWPRLVIGLGLGLGLALAAGVAGVGLGRTGQALRSLRARATASSSVPFSVRDEA